MIAHIFGKAVEKNNSSVIVDVHGVGYEIQVPMGDFDTINLNSEVRLYTYHHIREQSQELFGFSNMVAKKLFEMLITVQGVGPKAALAILSLGDAETLRNALANGDVAFITKASGVGKKTAERVIVDLSDKVGLPTAGVSGVVTNTNLKPANDEALEALMALGYNLNDGLKALESVPADLPTADRVTLALRGVR